MGIIWFFKSLPILRLLTQAKGQDSLWRNYWEVSSQGFFLRFQSGFSTDTEEAFNWLKSSSTDSLQCTAIYLVTHPPEITQGRPHTCFPPQNTSTLVYLIPEQDFPTFLKLDRLEEKEQYHRPIISHFLCIYFVGYFWLSPWESRGLPVSK